jgi:hypothetical protein
MADAVYQALDRMVPALEDLQIRGIFNKVSRSCKAMCYVPESY